MKNKRKSRALRTAEAHIAALKAVAHTLPPATHAMLLEYIDRAHEAQATEADFHATAARVAASRRSLEKAVSHLEQMSRDVLNQVRMRFGPNSKEYAAALGKERGVGQRPVPPTVAPDSNASDESSAPTS